MTGRIAIHSAPRSGSTWLGEIFNSSPGLKYCFQPLFSYALKDFLSDSSSAERVNEFFDELLAIEDDFVDQVPQRDEGKLPIFEKQLPYSHVCYKEVRYHNILENLVRVDGGVKLVLLVRNPVEVIDSWVGAPREFDESWDVDEELLAGESKNQGRPEEFFGLNRWIAATRIYRKLSDEFSGRATLVNYRDLKADPLAIAKRLFDFCELELTGQTAEFLNRSTTDRVDGTYSVFRGSVPKVIRNIEPRHVALIEETVRAAGLEEYLA